MDSPYRRELEVAIGAVQAAARLSQRVIASHDKGVVQKSDFSPVTIADFAIQALLTATIKAAFPGDTFVGEEDAASLRADLILLEHVYEQLHWDEGEGEGEGEGVAAGEADQPKKVVVPTSREAMCRLIDECGSGVPTRSGRTWIFDPIDGTKTYVRGELYAINVALLVDGQQTLGVVACPNLSMDAAAPLLNSHVHADGCVTYAVRGHGAFVRPLKGAGDATETRRLGAEQQRSGSGGNGNGNGNSNGNGTQNGRGNVGKDDIRIVTSHALADSALDRVQEDIAERLGAAYPYNDLLPWVLRWVVLAMGFGNATYWVYAKPSRRAKPWDHAGAMLIFEETGGLITDVHGRPIDVATGRLMTGNFGFVAAGSEALHGRILETVKSVLVERGYERYLEPA
jgi:3'(2'), 5'-bisphosphate nucleotidase